MLLLVGVASALDEEQRFLLWQASLLAEHWAAVGMCELMLRRKPEGAPSVKFFASKAA